MKGRLVVFLVLAISLDCVLSQKVRYFEQKTDHFTFGKDESYFSQKYLVNDTFYRYDKGPILFYCGNEGPIEMFYNNTGFVTETLAQEMKGLVIFMEHRYFGDSYPFLNHTEALKFPDNKYLTSIQALHDYVDFLIWQKNQLGCGPNECPIVAFGGSYGGMLAAWIRMKFPNVVDASLASSAPIYQFRNRLNLNSSLFFSIATKNYEHGDCSQKIHQAYTLLSNLIEEKYGVMNENFIEQIGVAMKTCTPMKTVADATLLRAYLDTAYLYMAMTNYPQESNFLRHMPAWPANSSCIALESIDIKTSTVFELFSAIKDSTDTFYSYGKPNQCSDISQGDDGVSDNDMSGWDVLACADMTLIEESNGVTDMFYNAPFDYAQNIKTCNSTYGAIPDFDWALQFYGGISDADMLNYSKIFFSNGMLDPWSGASPTTFLSEDLPVNYMAASAHHNDLRLPQEGDPESVVQGRLLEIQYIKKWIEHKLPEGYYSSTAEY